MMPPPEGAKKESLEFPLELKGISENEVQLLLNIKETAETLLYHWKSFPIVLPTSLTEKNDSDRVTVDFGKLFKAPFFDELAEVAGGADGNAKGLSDNQLLQVWKEGEFDVNSIHFPAQVHRWRLSRLLQLGSSKSKEAFLQHTSTALRMIIITARNRISSPFFSLTESIKGLGKGVWQIFDSLIGMPSTSPGDVSYKISEERAKYLIAELDILPSAKQEWKKYCDYVREKCSLEPIEKHKTSELRPPPVPYVYITPNGQHMDFRLFNKELMHKLMAILENILQEQGRAWFVRFKESKIAELKSRNLSNEAISKKVSEAALAEYMNQVYDAILTNAEIEALQAGIGESLVKHAKSILIMQNAINAVHAKSKENRDKLQMHLKTAFPIRSRIPAWVNDQLQAFENDFVIQHLFAAHEDSITKCRQEELEQTLYFLLRDLNFLKHREAVLQKELGKVRIPTKEHHFSLRIWLPSNWRIYKTQYGETVRVKTTISDEPCPAFIGTIGPDEPTYALEDSKQRKTTTRYPFWRWWNYLNRTWTWLWNAMFWLGIVLPWSSPVGLRALFFAKPFYANFVLNQKKGHLCPQSSSLTQTLVSRLHTLWSNVRQSRRTFEEEPDTGFLGKSFTRHLNRFWNYVIKGALGTLGVCLVFPVICLVVSVISIGAALTSPVWVPVTAMLFHLIYILCYDFDGPGNGRNRVMIIFEALLWRLVIQGCLQPLAALLTAFLVCPLLSFFIMIGACLRLSMRGLWDTFIFYAVIKSRARVPSSDSFIARRISGPGLAGDYFLQMKLEQGLAAIEAHMEAVELEIWKRNISKQIEQPKVEFKSFVTTCFGPFSGQLVTHQGVYRTLDTECGKYLNDLETKVQRRSAALQTGLKNTDIKDKVKLPRDDLKILIVQATHLVKEFYGARIFPQLEDGVEAFWEHKQLEPKDFPGLTVQMLETVFNKDLMTPLEEADNSFHLEVKHLNLSRYVGMLATADVRDDLDLVAGIHTPQAGINVATPSVDVSVFDPDSDGVRIEDGNMKRQYWRRRPWKATQTIGLSKLNVPLAILHPSKVAIAIYNRLNPNDLILSKKKYKII